MANGIDKKALFKLKSEPYLKPISDLGVGFYNLDENTAILRFQLSNTKGPLLIHENNLTAYAYFESSNGSVSDVIELEIEDSFNGIVTITLDKEFLQASTSTKVKGQVYIGVNNVDGNPEYNEVAVFREFTFEVADALINKISSFTKIEYIRMFDQLKMRIEQKVRDIEEAIANGADYVAEMKSVLQQGIETLNAIVSDGKTDIQSFITQAKSDLDNTKDDAINDITSISNNAKTSVNETADGVIKNINNVSNDATEHIDGKVVEFNGLLETEGFLTPEKLGSQLDELEWQKYKTTNDDGSRQYVSGLDLLTAPPGQYESTNTINGPLKENGEPDTGFIESDISVSSNGRRLIMATRSSFNKTYIKTLHTNGTDTGWKEITNNQTDTGWVPFTIINGGRTNPAYGYNDSRNGYGCSYRTITTGSKTEKFIRVNADNIAAGQVIAQLPEGFAKSPQVGFIRAPLAFNGSSLIIENNGEVKPYINNSSEWTASEGNYIYGTISWIE